MLIELFNSRPVAAPSRPVGRHLAAVAPLSEPGSAVDVSNLFSPSTRVAPVPRAAPAIAQAMPEELDQGESPCTPPSFLAELEQEVRSLSVPEAPDRETLERNARLANGACRIALDYWSRLAEHLNVLKPSGNGRFVFDGRTVLEQRPGRDFRVVPKVRTAHNGDEHFESVTLSWRIGTSDRMTVVKEFPVDIERLRARLSFAGINVFETQARDPSTGRQRGVQFEFVADVCASVRITPLHDEGKVRLSFLNLDALNRTEADFPAFAIRPGELDDIARMICGRANKVFKHAQNVVRHDP